MKNAYMLVYERELKTPVKKLLVKDEVAKLKENSTAILACENTAQPRAAVGQICFDSQKNEYYTFADFYDVQPKVPEGLSKVVQEDNANFLFERQIYSPEFFKFVNDIFSESCALLPSLKGEEKTQTEKSLANVGIKVIFDVLSHAYHNTSIKTLTKQFIGLLYESTSALGQLLAFIKDRFIAEVLLTFYKCPDKDARVAVKDLISNAILAAIKNEEAAKTAPEADKYEEAKKLLFYACRIIILMISNVNNDLAQNWGRFEQFFEVLLVVAKEGNDGMRKYMNSKDIVKILIDFYLEKESPFYVRGETRNPMGNRFRYPTFDALIDLVCILSSYADLSFIQPEDAKLRPLFDMPPSVYKLSEDSQTALMSSQFLIKTITHRHSTMPFARLIAFLSYDSKEYSKTVVKAVLKGISADLTQNLTSYFNVIKELLMINDSLQQLRLEWMLGIANMNKMFTQLAPNEKPYEQIKFGLSLINSVRDNVNEYPSPLAYKSLYDSLLNLLWTHRKNFEIQHISCILSLMVKSPAAFQYVTSLPPPTYQFAKYSDWFKPFVQNYRSTAKGTGILLTLFNLKRDDTGHQEALRLISELDQQWEKVVEKQGRYTERPDVLLRYPKPYIVGKATGENTVLQETIDGVTLMVSELVTECFESLPTGKDNLAIPEGYLENLVIDTESKEEKKTNMKPFSVEPMVLKFEVRNSNFKLHTMIGVTKPMKIRINITGKSPLNFYAPASTLSYIVEANRWAIIYMVQKQVPGKPWGEFAVQWSAKPTAVQGDIYRAEYDGIEGNYYQMEDIFPEETVGTARSNSQNLQMQIGCECCKGELTTGGMLCKKCAELFYSSQFHFGYQHILFISCMYLTLSQQCQQQQQRTQYKFKFKLLCNMQPLLTSGLGLPIYSPDMGEDKAVPLIRLHKKAFVIEQEAIDLLKQIEKPIAFLCVCGKYRTGKSYLLNKVLLGTTDGFSVGSTINACTKGLWIWKRPFKYLTEDKEELVVFVVDTEGLGAIDEDENHDTKVVLLGLLLSSLMLYNSMGSIDENALNSLSLVVNISKTLQANNSGEKLDDDEFAKNFPSFFWILRDFSLQLKDPQGNPITPKQYLENALSLQKGSSEAVENKNKVRRLLKHFFADRDCATLVRPTEDEGDLQNLIRLPDDKLRKEFVDQLSVVKTKIRKKLRAKIVNGKKVNGPMLADLCIAYTDAINGGKVPSIDNAWTYVCKSQCETALNEAQKTFEEGVREKIFPKLPLSEQNVKEAFNEVKALSISKFKGKLVGGLAGEEELSLRKLLQKLKKEAKTAVYHKSKELCEDYFEKACSEITEKAKKGHYQNYTKYKEELLELLKKVPAEIREAPGYNAVEAEILLRKMLPNIEAITDQLVTGYTGEIKLLTQKLKAVEAENLTRKSDALKERELYGHKLHESEEDRMRLKTKVVLLEERNKSFTTELERQESKYREEIMEYKKRVQDLESSLRTAQMSYDKELQAQRDDWMRKDLEANKNAALQAQQLKFLEDKLEEYQNALSVKDEDLVSLSSRLKECEAALRHTQDELKIKEKKLNQLNKGFKTARQPSISSSLEVENAVLKKQLEMMQEQVTENKKAYSALMEAINKGLADTVQKETTLAITSKELAVAAEQAQQRCAALEAKVHRMRKYRTLIHAAGHIECKGCGNSYASNVFGAHIKLCQQLMKAEGHMQLLLSERSGHTTRNNSPTQVCLLLFLTKLKEYKVRVKYNSKHWIVTKSLHDFAALSEELIRQYPGIRLPECTALWDDDGAKGGTKEEKVMRKQRYLEAYLRVIVDKQSKQELLQNENIRETRRFKDFLGIDDEIPEKEQSYLKILIQVFECMLSLTLIDTQQIIIIIKQQINQMSLRTAQSES
eukprot:TRINITY_DN602_c1_g1_i1.p1 TRINITY_DN602_c1_g1~~TRINITY_DN602_c1_g1_i1.p1  ORF type:complete len:1870 (-),score=221.62 TRINITY_DN602_c1_g1_i1:13785-19394(-)